MLSGRKKKEDIGIILISYIISYNLLTIIHLLLPCVNSSLI